MSDDLIARANLLADDLGNGIRRGSTCGEQGATIVFELVAELDRVTAILAEIDTPHVVVLAEDSWFTEHDIACRRAGMAECAIHKAMSAIDYPPWPPGRYLATITADGNLSLTPAEKEGK